MIHDRNWMKVVWDVFGVKQQKTLFQDNDPKNYSQVFWKQGWSSIRGSSINRQCHPCVHMHACVHACVHACTLDSSNPLSQLVGNFQS